MSIKVEVMHFMIQQGWLSETNRIYKSDKWMRAECSLSAKTVCVWDNSGTN